MQETVFSVNEENSEECLSIASAILTENLSIKQVLSKFAKKDLQTVSANEKEFLLKQTFKLMKVLLKHQNLIIQNPQPSTSSLHSPATPKKQETETQTESKDPPDPRQSPKLSELETSLKSLQAYNNNLLKELSQYKIYAERHQAQQSKIEELSKEVSELTNKIVDLEPQYMMKVHKRHKYIDQEVKERMLGELPLWQKAATKIQKSWKGNKARKTYIQLLKQHVENQNKTKKTPERLVLAKFANLLKKQKLTLEDCFRAADLNGDKIVTCEEFSKFLAKLKLNVTGLEVSRLIEILDQDLSGKIESQEFYETLAAYRVISDTSKVKGYSGQVMKKLLGIMKERGISSEELFRSFDISNDGNIDLEELIGVCKGLGLIKREVVVLQEMMDTDENGLISKVEFMRKFKEEDGGFFQIEREKANMAMPGVSRGVKGIIANIEAAGMSLTKAFDLIHFPESGKVQISYIAGSFAKLFPSVNKDDIAFLLNSIDTSKTGNIYYKDLIVFLHSYAGMSEFTETQLQQHIISILTNQSTTIESLLESKGYPSILDISSFIKFCHESFNLSDDQSISIFNSLSNFTGRVTLNDLQNFTGPPQHSVHSLSPRSRSLKTVEEISQILSKHDLKIINIFKFADSKQTGRCSTNEFCSALRKLVPSLSETLIIELSKVLPATLTSRDLEIIVPERSFKGLDEFGLTEEEVFWVVKLKLSIEKMGIDPKIIFHESDYNKDSKISMDEFKNALKRCVPGKVLTYTDICLIFKAFDKNNDGGIDEQEFLQRLKDCSKSGFYKAALAKIAEQQGQYEEMKASVRPRVNTDDFPIPPMPLMHLSKQQDYRSIFENFVLGLQPSTRTHELLARYNLRLSSLITAKHLQQILNITEFEAERVFRYLDLHNKGVTYCFVLCTVIDSYRSSMNNFPIPHNNSADPTVVKILTKILIGLVDTPVFMPLQPLDAQVNWENFTSLPLAPQDVYATKAAFPKYSFNYHIAAALLNLSVGLLLCPTEILHNCIQRLEFQVQAVDFFSRFSLHPTDVLTHTEFLDKIGRVLEISTVEADTLFAKLNDSKISCKMLNFFTFFDMVLSMYNQGVPTWQIPKLPFKQEKMIRTNFLNFFEKLSGFIDKPFIKYGLNLSENYSVGELADAFEEFKLSKAEKETYFMLLGMNKNPRIRCYHLAAILDSYDAFNKSLTVALDLKALRTHFSVRTSGSGFLKAKNYQLDHSFVLQDLPQLLPMVTPSYLDILFNFIDTYSRGFIYAYQLATVIDLSLKLTDFNDFPFCANPKIKPQIKALLSSNSRHLDVYNKSAISFYQANKIPIEEELDLRRFQVTFSFELTDKEAEEIFYSLDFSKQGKIKIIHYISCVETFCRNNSNSFKVLPESPQMSLYKLVFAIPDNISTVDYFNDLSWHSRVSKDAFVRYLSVKFSLNTPTVFEIFSELNTQLEEFFAYQFLTIIDLYRSCVDKGKIVKEPGNLPFKHKAKDIQTELIFTTFANRLDDSERGSCDYFWAKGIDPTEEISVQEFFLSLSEINSQQCGQLFKDLDFKKTGQTVLYHFLAVLETYREKMIENFCKPVKSKKKVKQTEALPMVISPLQDALNRLGRYIAGDNPKRRPLTSNEIFGMMDYNSDGSVTMNEFLDCLNLLPLNLTQNQIYLLLKEADLNGDGVINYKEFTNFILDFVKKPEIKAVQSSVVPKPQIRQVKALKPSVKIEPDSIEDAILNLKLYIESNKASHYALELVFGKIDYMSSGFMTPDEFILGLDRLKLPFSQKQKQSLLQFADKNRNGLIPYKDFIDFLYSYSFTEQFAEVSSIVVSVKDYVLKPADFFTKYSKTTTVLNSEKSALKRCYELLQKGGKFVDSEFGPEIGKNGANCLYFNGKPPTASYPKSTALEWPDVTEVIKDAKFVKDRISSNDVVQGSLANCWFIGALSVLATRDELVRGSVQDLSVVQQIDASTAEGLGKGVYPPIFHCLSKRGLFVFRFFKEFAWRYVIVDSRIPMIKQENKFSFVFGHCEDSAELWVPLIEKAYAKLHGCYEALNNGLIDDALVDLTGLASERLSLQSADSEILWKTLLESKHSQNLLGCSIESQDSHGEIVIDGEPTGLLSKHAYAIIDLFAVPNPNTVKGRNRLLRLRNPWGQREWKGKWSSSDQKLISNLKALKEYIEKQDPDEKFDPTDPNDGTFLMCFKDWRGLFSNLFTCVDFPDHWSGLRIKGKWTETSSGGVPADKSKKSLAQWGKNPQIVLKIEENCEIFVSLSQRDGRFLKEAFPYKKNLFFICFSIMKMFPNENGLKEFDEKRVVKLSKLRLHREVSLRTVLGAGSYCIVPATQKVGQLGEFSLSVYFSCEKEKVVMKMGEVDAEVIAEEEEAVKADPATIKALRNAFEEIHNF